MKDISPLVYQYLRDVEHRDLLQTPLPPLTTLRYAPSSGLSVSGPAPLVAEVAATLVAACEGVVTQTVKIPVEQCVAVFA
jgi:hypothetical protein